MSLRTSSKNGNPCTACQMDVRQRDERGDRDADPEVARANELAGSAEDDADDKRRAPHEDAVADLERDAGQNAGPEEQPRLVLQDAAHEKIRPRRYT